MRTRRRAVWAVLCASVLAAAACGGGDDDTSVRAAEEGQREPTRVLGTVIERDDVPKPASTAPTATTAQQVEGDGEGSSDDDDASQRAREPSATAEPAAPAPPPAPPTTACHPRDDDCDGWWWSTDPGPNAPLELSVSVAPAAPTAGDELVITIRAADADAAVGAPFVCLAGPGELAGWVGEDRIDGCLAAPHCVARPSGEQQVPARHPSSGQWQIRYTPPEPGTYDLSVDVASHATDGCSPDPYASAALDRQQLVVAAT